MYPLPIGELEIDRKPCALSPQARQKHIAIFGKSGVHCEMLCKTFGRMNLSEITPPLIERFKQKRLEGKTMYGRTRHPATVNRELCVLSKIFSIAFNAELIESNPCRRVRKFRADCRRTRYLSFDEETRLFEKLQGQEWIQRIVTMAMYTGMRQGEIFNLTWFDVDFSRNTIHIRVSKNGKDRFVPMNQTVREMLEGQQLVSEYVFPSPKTKGRLIDIKSRFDKAKRDAGLKDFRFHDLRHTAATRMADGGADAFTLAAIFGWSDVRMTTALHPLNRRGKAPGSRELGQVESTK